MEVSEFLSRCREHEGKVCNCKLFHAAVGQGSLCQINSKAELWLTRKAKGSIAKQVTEALGLPIPEYEFWFLIRSDDWVPKCDKFLHMLGEVAMGSKNWMINKGDL